MKGTELKQRDFTCICPEVNTELSKKQPQEQAGFRRGYSTMDNLHTVNQLIEKTLEYNKPLCQAFEDYEKKH